METNQNKYREPFTVTDNWDSQSKALQATFPQLTSEDLRFEKGQENALIARIVKRLNKNPEEVINILKKGDKIKKN